MGLPAMGEACCLGDGRASSGGMEWDGVGEYLFRRLGKRRPPALRLAAVKAGVGGGRDSESAPRGTGARLRSELSKIDSKSAPRAPPRTSPASAKPGQSGEGGAGGRAGRRWLRGGWGGQEWGEGGGWRRVVRAAGHRVAEAPKERAAQNLPRRAGCRGAP